MTKHDYSVDIKFGGTYFVGVLSCWYHGFGFWASIVWPWYVGAAMVAGYN